MYLHATQKDKNIYQNAITFTELNMNYSTGIFLATIHPKEKAVENIHIRHHRYTFY